MSIHSGKVVLGLSVAMLLGGCAVRPASMQEDLDSRIAEVNASAALAPIYSHADYTFYVEPSIGRIESDQASDILSFNGTKFVVNLNVPAIVNHTYYPDEVEEETFRVNAILLAESQGSYLDDQQNEHPFDVKIYSLDGSYLTLAETDTIEGAAVSCELEAPMLGAEMVKIARSIHVDTDKVIARYSNRKDISYHRQRLELFQNIAPVNGAVNELFENSNSAGGGSTGEFIGDNFTDPETEPTDAPSPTASASAQPSASASGQG